jgi:hypothetical protein
MSQHSIGCPGCSRLRLVYVQALHAVMSRGTEDEYKALARAQTDARKAWKSRKAECKARQL